MTFTDKIIAIHQTTSKTQNQIASGELDPTCLEYQLSLNKNTYLLHEKIEDPLY